MAQRHGISRQTVSEIWRAFGLKPWRHDEFKVSPDPDLIEKIRDLVGLYLSPPVAAAVYAVDEKPQIQALNRSAPILPMLPTTPQRATHDYLRNGTLDLFAALDIATGKVISDLRKTHAAKDFIAFLNKIDTEVPDDLDVHVILDNLSTHKTPAVHDWLLRHRPLPLPLHPHLRIMDEPGRALVLSPDHQEAATLRPRQRQSPRRRHPSLGRQLERQPETLHLAQDRQPDPRPARRLLPSRQQLESVPT